MVGSPKTYTPRPPLGYPVHFAHGVTPSNQTIKQSKQSNNTFLALRLVILFASRMVYAVKSNNQTIQTIKQYLPTFRLVILFASRMVTR